LLRTATPILNKFLRNTFPSLTADGDFRAVLVIVEFTNDCCPDKARIFRARARVRIVVGLELELGDDDDDDDVVVYPVVVLIAVDAELLSRGFVIEVVIFEGVGDGGGRIYSVSESLTSSLQLLLLLPLL